MTTKPYKKLVLVVLDGFGLATGTQGNAIAAAGTPYMDSLVDHYPSTSLQASGPSVGLPWSEMGNSEVGHMNLGAGRIVGQDLSRITAAVEDRTFFSNPAFLAAAKHAKENDSVLHLVGLASPGGVHSFDEHLYALLGFAAEQGVAKVHVHMFLDGRDTPPQIALESVEKLNQKIKELGVGRIVSVTGRFYSMDRAEHWNLTEQTYRAMVFGEGTQFDTAENAIKDYYSQHVYDEMVPPTVIRLPDGGAGKIQDNDAVIFFNFRSDRILQVASAFCKKGFAKFEKPVKAFKNLFCVTMTEFAPDLEAVVAFPPQEIVNGFAEIVSKQGLRQFHVAESEKYAHVSVFFNGGIVNQLPGEDRKIVTSPQSNYQNYADVPEMSAYKVTDELIGALKGNYSFIVANYANADMVGHTGNMQASIQAVRVVDDCVHRVAQACLEEDACLIVTADHGNIEELVDVKSGSIDKEHSTSPVPLILVGRQFERPEPAQGGLMRLATVLPIGVLSDVAPTMVELMDMDKPAEMTGVSLLPQLLPSQD